MYDVGGCRGEHTLVPVACSARERTERSIGGAPAEPRSMLRASRSMEPINESTASPLGCCAPLEEEEEEEEEEEKRREGEEEKGRRRRKIR